MSRSRELDGMDRLLSSNGSSGRQESILRSSTRRMEARMKTYPSADGKAAFVALERGEDLLEGLNRAVEALRLEAATLHVIGGLEEATVGYFDPKTKRYLPTSTGHVEISSGLGNVSIRDGNPFIHLHLVLSGPDGAV